MSCKNLCTCCDQQRSQKNSIWDFKKEFKHPKFNFSMQGHSVSAEQTGFYLPNWKIMFDAGLNCPYEAEHIFITHTHSDHAQQLAAILSGNKKCPTVYLPCETSVFMKNLLVAKQQMSKCDLNITWEDIKNKCKFVEMEPGQRVEITVRKNAKFIVQALKTAHEVPSIGFALYEGRSRLKQEFKSLAGKELGKLRKNGVELKEEYFAPWLAYIGDSTVKWHAENKDFIEENFPYIICECTFVAELENNEMAKIANPFFDTKAKSMVTRAKEAAEIHYHTCWEDLEPLIKTQNQAKKEEDKTTFILVHWSKRYEKKKIDDFFAEQDNVYAWTWNMK